MAYDSPTHAALNIRLRVELYAAAQTFGGNNLDDFIHLLDEVSEFAKVERESRQSCDQCGRKTFTRSAFNTECAMPQPDGVACSGTFR